MTTLHPHWHATEDERPREEAAAHRLSPEIPVRSVSRRPAAAVGIALSLLAGFLCYNGTLRLPGQAAAAAPDVRLTREGPVPSSFTVEPGRTVTWKNDDTIPYILQSDTLRLADGLLDTSAVFPGDTVTVTIPASAPAGEHEYRSPTSTTFAGKIVVGGTMGPLGGAISAPALPVPASSPSSVAAAASSVSADTASSASSRAAAVPASSGPPEIPRNPFTVGSPVAAPPLAAATTPAVPAAAKPLRQPESGPGLWIVGAGSVLGLHLATRRAFKRT